jgi:hypothetical protein
MFRGVFRGIFRDMSCGMFSAYDFLSPRLRSGVAILAILARSASLNLPRRSPLPPPPPIPFPAKAWPNFLRQ